MSGFRIYKFGGVPVSARNAARLIAVSTSPPPPPPLLRVLAFLLPARVGIADVYDAGVYDHC
eukprot:119822-Rhodomonas_salina.1